METEEIVAGSSGAVGGIISISLLANIEPSNAIYTIAGIIGVSAIAFIPNLLPFTPREKGNHSPGVKGYFYGAIIWGSIIALSSLT